MRGAAGRAPSAAAPHRAGSRQPGGACRGSPLSPPVSVPRQPLAAVGAGPLAVSGAGRGVASRSRSRAVVGQSYPGARGSLCPGRVCTQTWLCTAPWQHPAFYFVYFSLSVFALCRFYWSYLRKNSAFSGCAGAEAAGPRHAGQGERQDGAQHPLAPCLRAHSSTELLQALCSDTSAARAGGCLLPCHRTVLRDPLGSRSVANLGRTRCPPSLGHAGPEAGGKAAEGA